MNLPVIEMEKEQAQEAFREYRDAVRAGPKEKFLEVRREYEAMDRAVMRGYKEIAKGNSLLRLSEAIRLGGTQQLTWTGERWRNDRWENVTYVGTFPRLAITRADARRSVPSSPDEASDQCSPALPDLRGNPSAISAGPPWARGRRRSSRACGRARSAPTSTTTPSASPIW
jgi:hypothetical protein